MRKLKSLTLIMFLALAAICIAVGLSACSGKEYGEEGEILSHNIGEWEARNGIYLGMVSDRECPAGAINERYVKKDIEMQTGEEYYFIIDFTFQPLEDNDGRGSVDVNVEITPAVAIDVTLQETSSGTFTENTFEDIKQITVPFSIPEKADEARDKRIILRLKPAIASEYDIGITFNADKPLTGNLTDSSIGKTISTQYTEGMEYTESENGSYAVSVGSATKVGEITVPYYRQGKYITEFGKDAFISCSELTSINISEKITAICEYAFYNCYNLENITIPNSVEKIGEYAFSQCNSLTSITIPDSVSEMGERVCYNCPNLTSIIIGNSVKDIGEYAFCDCRKLTSITIGNSVMSIGNSAFSGCSGLTSITIPDGVTSIGNSAFDYCREMTSIKIGNGVTNIGMSAFAYCSKLTSVFIPFSVKNIEYGAFKECSRLSKVIIGNGVTNIGNNAFENCYWLTSITIGENVEGIGDSAFKDCKKLIEIYNKSELDITEGNSVAYGGIASYAKNVYVNEGGSKLKTDINGFIIYDFDTLANYIGTNTDITTPDGITSIGDYAFGYCSGLTSITISNNVTNIGEYAFFSCSGLTGLSIGNGVRIIGNKAIGNCNSLTSLSVNINNYKFYSQGNCVIERESKKLILGCKSSVIPNDITSIGDWAFAFCNGLTSITIPDSVTTIGSSAFSCCERLTSITIPNSVSVIDIFAFSGCSGLTSVTLGLGLKSIGNFAFYKCSSLTDIYYNSLKLLWAAINKGTSWNEQTGTYTVHCADGNVKK